MSTYQTDARVDDYIATLPAWRQAICRRVRDLAQAARSAVGNMSRRGDRHFGDCANWSSVATT